MGAGDRARATARGGWYRVYPGYVCPGGGPANANGPAGATYNRLGPAVSLVAPGEPTRWSEHIAADDSSQSSRWRRPPRRASSQENRDLTAAELRALMALTADVPAVVDGGRGLAAGSLDARDRLGHSLKIGHGPVNVRAARLAAVDPFCLALFATRPVPDPPRRIAGARARAGLAGRGAPRGRGRAASALAPTRASAGRVSRLFLTSLPVQEAFCWLARHVRALAEAARMPRAGSASITARWWNAFVTRSTPSATRSGPPTNRTPPPSSAGAGGGARRCRRGRRRRYRLGKSLGPAVMAGDGEQGRAWASRSRGRR